MASQPTPAPGPQPTGPGTPPPGATALDSFFAGIRRGDAALPENSRDRPVLGITLRRRIVTMAGGLSRGRPIRVVFRGDGARTDGTTIYLPTLRDMALIPLAIARAYIGYVLHECAHILYTDFSLQPPGDPLARRLTNIVEDCWIEKRLMRDLPGTRADLNQLDHSLAFAWQPDNPTLADPLLVSGNALLEHRSRLCGYTAEFAAANLALVDEPIAGLVADWARRMDAATSTADAIALGTAFADELRALFPPQNARQPDSGQPNSHQPDTNQPDADNANAGDPDRPTNDDSDSPDPPDDAHLPASATASRGDGDRDAAPILAAIGDRNADAPDLDSSANDPVPLGLSPDRMPEDNPEDSHDPNHPAAGRNRSQSWADHRHRPPPGSGTDVEGLAALNDAARAIIGPTARILRRLVMGQRQSGTLRRLPSGDFDIRALPDIVRGTGNVHSRRWQTPANRWHLGILVDMSGSMAGEPVTVAAASGLAITQGLAGSDIALSLWGFTGRGTDLEFTVFAEPDLPPVQVRQRLSRFDAVPMGATPTGPAMAGMLHRLWQSPIERRLMITLTDGAADDQTLAGEVDRIAPQLGIPSLIIGIGADARTGWATHQAALPDITGLPALLDVLVRQMLRTGVTRHRPGVSAATTGLATLTRLHPPTGALQR